MSNRKGVLTLIFNPRVLLPHTPTHSWVGEGRPSKTEEGKAAEMSHQDRKRERAKEKGRERKRGNAEPATGHGKLAHGGEAATRWQCYPVVGAPDAARNWTGGFG